MPFEAHIIVDKLYENTYFPCTGFSNISSIALIEINSFADAMSGLFCICYLASHSDASFLMSVFDKILRSLDS